MNFFLVSIIAVFLIGFVAGRFTFSSAPKPSAPIEEFTQNCSAPVKPSVKAAPTTAATPSGAPAKSEQELLAQIAQNSPCNPEVFDDPIGDEIIEDHEDRGEPLDYPEPQEEGPAQ